LRSALKAGYLENIGEKVVRNDTGTPQGSILSPVLCNIYLHEMDLYIKQIIYNFNKGTNRKINYQYKK
jgi:RNA-directed DNA polymerase